MNTPKSARSAVPKLALSREETSHALGVTPSTLDRLERRGLIFPSRATRRPLYPIPEIERFLRETTVVGALKANRRAP